MATIDVMTISDLKNYIKKADIIWCTVRFGVNDKETKLLKKEALLLIEGIDDDTTPDHFEMYGSVFGRWDEDNNVLWFG